jgi:transcriptional regulator with XRE-family HTH domain
MAESARELIGRRVREERVRGGFTHQASFAASVGLDAPTLSRIETGKRGIDSVVLQRIADRLGIPLDSLVRDPDPQFALARNGDADDEAMQPMIEWASRLLEDMEVMARYVGRKPLR